ncbi:hypothetical protein K458DRAFT_420096 [Lentithecium fluviatile CBS 122367]|uniref:Fungal calcium binding protein domain-containing protein n=1 Tax=Lentithecium fluviatile CBS 122367 TaxID=1168545 RepID=A0A6G1IW15_9PLEO|nr:hypothetical protein K458DRAFT_420096 [Lentithecium fluviatile CBS 122367]
MRSFLQLSILALCTSFVGANPLTSPSTSADPAVDGCPKDEYACLDVMNASQCIEQLIIEKQAPATKEALVKCVETEGTATTLPGATKYCRCPGCHTKAINDVLVELFPPPCA